MTSESAVTSGAIWILVKPSSTFIALGTCETFLAFTGQTGLENTMVMTIILTVILTSIAAIILVTLVTTQMSRITAAVTIANAVRSRWARHVAVWKSIETNLARVTV
jgi:hypothetical protein